MTAGSIVLTVLLLGALPHFSAADTLPAGFERPRAYIVQVDGNMIASHAEHVQRQPASLAKLAAALVIMEAQARTPRLLDAEVVVSARAARTRGTRLGLQRDDRVRLRDLLAAMLVGSANDACLALAEHVAGDSASFAARMNETARRLGMSDTHFADPCGFDRPGQHTTAADMLKLAEAALQEPLITSLAGEKTISVATLRRSRTFTVTSTNALLDGYPGAFGLKTGYTGEAGPCLIAAARRGSTIAIVVVLGTKDRWPVAVALLDEAFDRVSDIPRIRDRRSIGEREH